MYKKKRINARIQVEGRDFNSGTDLNILFWCVFFTKLHEMCIRNQKEGECYQKQVRDPTTQ